MDKFTRQFCRQRGFSLIEILAALALGVLMMTSLVSMVDVTLQDTKGQQTAQYQSQFAAAAARYLNDNVTTLQPMVVGGATASINLATLQPSYLPSTFAAVNAYKQAPCMLVRASATANQLDALIVTEGGDPIPPKDIGYIAANAGTGGGSIRLKNLDIPSSPVIAEGAFGAWELDATMLQNFITTKCSLKFAGIGNMATLLAYGGPNAINRNVLFRNPMPSDPALNQMNVPLGFTNSVMKTTGDPCIAPGITLEKTTGDILKCTGGFWEPSGSKYWKDPVLTFASLPPTATNGEVRMTLDFGRAYMFDSSSPQKWRALAVDQLGDLVVDNDLKVGRNIIANNNITATQTIKGNLIIASTAVVAQSLSPTLKHFTAGEGCNYPGFDAAGLPVTYLSYGSIVSDVNGLIMECKFTLTPPLTPTGSQGIFLYVEGTSTTPPP